MAQSAEIQAKIMLWRHKGVEGTLTKEDMIEAIAVLRQDRTAAATATDKAKKSKAIKNIPSADDLLSELGDL